MIASSLTRRGSALSATSARRVTLHARRAGWENRSLPPSRARAALDDLRAGWPRPTPRSPSPFTPPNAPVHMFSPVPPQHRRLHVDRVRRPTRRRGADCLVKRVDMLLLGGEGCRKRRAPQPDWWFVGGRIFPGETPQPCRRLLQRALARDRARLLPDRVLPVARGGCARSRRGARHDRLGGVLAPAHRGGDDESGARPQGVHRRYGCRLRRDPRPPPGAQVRRRLAPRRAEARRAARCRAGDDATLARPRASSARSPTPPARKPPTTAPPLTASRRPSCRIECDVRKLRAPNFENSLRPHRCHTATSQAPVRRRGAPRRQQRRRRRRAPTRRRRRRCGVA